MTTAVLNITNLTTSINQSPVLKNLSFQIPKEGEIHIIMGPNGCGKSTLSKTLTGHPSYVVEKGEILFKNVKNEVINVLELTPNERALNGIFLGFQNPIEITGISNLDFLKEVYNQHAQYRNEEIYENTFLFENKINNLLQQVNLSSNFLYRNVNEGFSGGEKKRNELLQLLLIKPKLVILDEIDSGLDIDSMEIALNLIKTLLENNSSIILISHYTNFIKKIFTFNKSVKIYKMQNGEILQEGGIELVDQIEKSGFN